MIETTNNIFLTYANNSIKENPNILREIVNEIEKTYSLSVEPKDFLKQQADSIIYCLQRGVRDIKEMLINKKIIDLSILGCVPERMCPFGVDTRRAKLDEWEIDRSSMLSCFQCDQQYFINVLNHIIDGKEYNEIDGFKDFITKEFSKIWAVEITKSTSEGYPYKEELRERIELQVHPDYIWGSFRIFLIEVTCYSLSNFLLKNDRRKLKRCPYCKNFFIAKSIKRETKCYGTDCERAYQRDKKRKQRDEEPDIYY